MGDPVSPVSCSEDLDCAGECGGYATLDCAGTCNGAAILDGNNCTIISYSATIQPIFDTNCTGCHGGSAGLFLDTYANLILGNVVSSGDSINSLLIKKLKGTAGTQMPQNKDPLGAQIITLIATWIQEGAKDN